jgi:site-specific recombinase XerD
MKLEDGINLYVRQKQATGMSFATGHKIYRSFLNTVGNLSLSQIKVDHISRFLNGHQISAKAFRRKHSLLRRFFDYWAAHGAMAWLSMPANRPAQRSNFLPYIYTREELRRLIRSAHLSRTPNDKIHHKTVRATLLTLYATGATVGEVTRLSNEDVDLQNGLINFSGSLLKAQRCIPIGRDLVRAVWKYVEWQKRMGAQSSFLFSRIDGRGISPRALRAYFERLRRKAGIAGYRESSQKPCLRDLRATFAVHRVTLWIKRKDDLNLMLPALGGYIGNVGLESTERYLQLTPERFQSALNKLSPPKSRTRWREDSELLEFLTSL